MFTDERRGGYLHIGQTKVSLRSEHDAAAMVPDVLFYDNQQVGLLSTTNTMWGIYENYFLITSASSCSGRHVQRLCSRGAPTVGRKPRSWQEQDCGSIPLPSQSPKRVSPTTQVCGIFHNFVLDFTGFPLLGLFPYL